jgi:hypothetical protein
MESVSNEQPSQQRLRAVVEIIRGELKIYPIADSDQQAKEILDSLLLWRRND